MKADAASWESVQSQAIGSVTMVIGDAYVLAGSDKRPLETGDQVFPDEVVKTGDGSQIHITFNDQSWFDMGAGSTTVLDADVYQPVVAADEAGESLNDEATTDVETLQEALAAGGDPSALAPTAAGGASNEGGHDAVFVERNGEQTDIEMSSLDTSAIAAVLTDAPQADDLLFDEKPEECDPEDPESVCYEPNPEVTTIQPPPSEDA